MQILRTALSSTFAKRLLRDERGLSTVEYVILLALIAVAGITAWDRFGGTIMDKVDQADQTFQTLGEE